jgi:hybrid cluster-associated redox disulfide protein
MAAKPTGLITARTRIEDMIRAHPSTVPVLEEYGLQCQGCALVPKATVALGALRHHLDLKSLLRDLNRAARSRR